MKYDLAKTLFVTDLDGTLLRSDGTLAKETAAAFNCMAAAGMKLTFATARSYHTAMLVAGALQPQIPLILHNGTFLADRADAHVQETPEKVGTVQCCFITARKRESAVATEKPQITAWSLWLRLKLLSCLRSHVR